MKKLYFIQFCFIFLYCCEKKVTLPDIDVSLSKDGIVQLPDNVPDVFKKYFVKYTKILSPNGKPIHILAQDGWTNDQIKHGRNVLEHILEDYPGSVYGEDKSHIANSMSDKKATMVFFNTEPDLEKAFQEGLGEATDLSMQDLRSNECPAVGSDDYMNHITRDASYEEIWHLVHDYGIKPRLPKMIKEMRLANDKAEKMGWRAWPEDEPQEHPNEYVGVLIDNYYDLWKTMPILYEGVPIKDRLKKDSFDQYIGKSHFGRYFANNHESLLNEDPSGYAILENFFHPYLTYTPELPRDFTGVFSLLYNDDLVYTQKSQYLVNIKAAGNNNITLIGNKYDNRITGNNGNNKLIGNEGNDFLIGSEGLDTVVFRGDFHEYSIQYKNNQVIISDKTEQRDGIDTLSEIELGIFNNLEHKFSDFDNP